MNSGPSSFTITNLLLSYGGVSDIINNTVEVNNRIANITITAQNQASQQLYKISLVKLPDLPVVTTYIDNHKWGRSVIDPVKAHIPTWLKVTNVLNVPMEWELRADANYLSGSKSGENGILFLTEGDIGLFSTYLSNDAKSISFSLTANGHTYSTNILYEPSEIWTWQDLQAIRGNLSGDYRLMQNIDFPEGHSYNFQTIKGIGVSYSDPKLQFTGSLDGRGYSVNHLYIHKNEIENYVGLFGVIGESGEVTNIHLRNALVLADANYQGGIAGYNNGHVSGSLTGKVAITNKTRTVQYLGGLVGYNDDRGATIGYVDAEISGDNYVGGLVGYSKHNVTGYASGKVSGMNYIGGLVGYIQNGAVVGYSTNDITGKEFIGGLVGYNSSSRIYGYANGDITGFNNIGGLVGVNQATLFGYFRGSITKESQGQFTNVGLIAGTNNMHNSQNFGVYHSLKSGEAQFFPAELSNGHIGEDGTGIDASTSDTNYFTLLQPSSEVWSFTDKKWPKIIFSNPILIGPQPIDPNKRR